MSDLLQSEKIIDKSLAYDNIDQLRQAMEKAHPHLADIDEIVTEKWGGANKALRGVKINQEEFDEAVINFYMTDPISRVSKTMIECTKEFSSSKNDNAKTKQAAA